MSKESAKEILKITNKPSTLGIDLDSINGKKIQKIIKEDTKACYDRCIKRITKTMSPRSKTAWDRGFKLGMELTIKILKEELTK